MMDKQYQRLQDQIDKAEADLQKALQAQKELQGKKKSLERKARNHLIYTIGGALEPYLVDAAVLTGDDVKSILELAFGATAVKQRVTARVNARHAEAAAQEEPISVPMEQPIPSED